MRWVVLAALWAGPALACEVTEPLRPADFVGDAVVVAARVMEFRSADGAVELTIWPDVTLAGKLPDGPMIVRWGDVMGATPPDPQPGDRIILGLSGPDEDSGWFLETPLCGTAHLLPDTPDNRESIAFALVGIDP